MAQLEQAFDSISNENNSPKTLSRRSVKELIQKEIKGVEFHKPTRANEPEKAINRSEKWVFSGSLDTMTHDHCPEELTCFFRVINLKSIADALGPTKTAALPAFHALTGADVTGSFSGKGKATCWDEFDNASTPILQALANLGLEQLVCRMYQPKTDIKTVKALRWSLFKKNQAESERLPPTQAALHQAILRAHYQLLVWNNDHVANPVLPSPEGYGWQDEDGKWVPVMTNLPPAPEATIQLVRCKCAKSRCSNNRCQCQKAGLVCTDLCLCSEDCQN
ncbi:unnamed protein product, partial [Porites evermanni]